MYRYKHKKTGKIVERKTPMPATKKQDYILVSWIRNMMMKANKIMQK